MLMSTQKKEHGTCSFGVGIEAGMFSVPEVETKYMDSSICAIYDGERYYIGFSPSFEYPQTVVDRIDGRCVRKYCKGKKRGNRSSNKWKSI